MVWQKIKIKERRRQSHLAKFVHDKAVLPANKKAAIAEAKLKAIEQAIEDEEDDKITLAAIPGFTELTLTNGHKRG